MKAASILKRYGLSQLESSFLQPRIDVFPLGRKDFALIHGFPSAVRKAVYSG